MKFRTGFIANSFSSSFVLEICIELANGDNVSFRGRGSCGEGVLSDFGELTMTVSPRELGHAASVKALVDMLRDGVVDSGFMNKKLRIMDEQDSERIKEANIARAKNHPVAASYDSAISFIRRVETIPDMDAINKIRVTGNEYNTKQYLRTYEYDRVTDSYTRKITGAEFEKNGGSGGDLIFTDGALAVDPRTVGSFRFTENLHFLNFKNRVFVTTGFTNAENRQIEKEITARGGRMGQSVGDQCYCLIVNENYGRATEKYDRAVKYNSGKDLPFRLFSYYKTQKDAEDNGPVIFIISGGMFQGFLARPEGNSEAPSFPPYYRHGHRLIDVSAQVEKLDLSGSEIQCAEPDAFKSCEQLRRLTLPTDELET